MRQLRPALLALGLLGLGACLPNLKNPLVALNFVKGLKGLLAIYDIPESAIDPILTDLLTSAPSRDIVLPAEDSPADGAPVKGAADDELIQITSSGPDAFGVFQLQRELRHPFQFQVTTGLFDTSVSALLDGGFSAIEADVIASIGSEQLQFVFEGAQPLFVGGAFSTMNVFVSTENGAQGQLAIASPIVDLALESNGTNIDALARAHGELTWQLVATVERPAPDATWYPSVGVANMGAGGALGFKDFAITANGESPAKAGTIDDAIEQAWNGWSGLSRARDALEGAAPDTVGAGEQLQLAFDALAASLQVATDLSDAPGATKFLKKAIKQLKPAGKKAAAVLGKVEEAKPKGLVKKLDKAQQAALRAVAGLRGQLLTQG